MSETAPERTPTSRPAGPKIMGVDRRTAIIFGVALVGGLAYFLWKRKKTGAATTAAAGTPCTDASGQAGTYDASGNCVATTAAGTGVDYSGQLSVIQTELESLMAAQGQDTDKTATTPPPTGNPGGPPQGGGGGTTTALAAPKALTVTKLNRAGNQASAQFAWDDVQGATNYTITVYLGSNNKAVTGPFQTNGPLANAGNLKPQTSYRVCVNANPGGPKSCLYFRTH